MKKSLVGLMVILITLTACNFPSQATPKPNLVDTEVARLLTALPATSTTISSQLTPVTITQNITFATTLTATSTLTPPATQTVTLSPTITPTLTYTATILPTESIQGLGNPTWKNPSDWKGFFLNPTDPDIMITQANGGLVLTAVHANGWHGWSMTYIKGTNFYLEGTFNINNCSGLDRYGLVFRAPDTTQGYFFGVSCDGEYSLRTWVSGGFTDTDIIPWTKSSEIITGSNKVNVLGVMAKDNHFTLYANGKQLGEASDNAYLSSGIFGAFIASVNTPNLTVAVQAMSFWNQP